MIRAVRIPARLAALALAMAATAQQPSPQAPPPPPSSPAALQPVQLDHVVAIIGSNVLLQSDVEQEMQLSALEPLQVLPGQNTPDAALRRLIDRTLILEQMEQQQQSTTTAAPEVQKSIEQLRKEIPACARYHCENEQGWDDFLKAHDLTPELVQQRWSQRMAMLHFIDLRFRSGIRISQEQIAAYYHNTLAPALEKEHQFVPPLDTVSARVQEILLQQQVSGLFQDWLSSLRDQGNVRIVDDAYNADLGLTSHTPGTSE
ncbi:MAG: peptidylprolyl isomerase [Acidobacteriaceae bacterium]